MITIEFQTSVDIFASRNWGVNAVNAMIGLIRQWRQGWGNAMKF